MLAINHTEHSKADAAEVELIGAEALLPAELEETSEADELPEARAELEAEARSVNRVSFDALMLA